MKKIAISQRVDFNNYYEEKRDCLDQRWTQLLNQLDYQLVPLPNYLKDPVDWFISLNLDGFIISGGNNLGTLGKVEDVSLERDLTEKLILDYLEKTNIPVIGVCRGMQFLHSYYKGKLKKIKNHSGIPHTIHLVGQNNYLKNFGFKEISIVNSYHNWGINKSDLTEFFYILAVDSQNNVEAFKHSSLNWWGFMWHPERNKPIKNEDLKLIKMILE